MVFTEDAVRVCTRPWPRDATSPVWLVFEGLLGGSLALPLILGLGVAAASAAPMVPLRPLLGGLAVATWATGVAWVVGSTTWRNAWTLELRCTPTLLQLTWRFGGLLWSADEIGLEHIREVRTAREGPMQVPVLKVLRRRGRPALRQRLRGASIEEVRWMAHLIEHARARNHAFWRHELAHADDDARRALLKLRSRSPGTRQ